MATTAGGIDIGDFIESAEAYQWNVLMLQRLHTTWLVHGYCSQMRARCWRLCNVRMSVK